MAPLIELDPAPPVGTREPAARSPSLETLREMTAFSLSLVLMYTARPFLDVRHGGLADTWTSKVVTDRRTVEDKTCIAVEGKPCDFAKVKRVKSRWKKCTRGSQIFTMNTSQLFDYALDYMLALSTFRPV